MIEFQKQWRNYVSSLVNKLNRAKEVKNDEYYTSYDDVGKYFKFILPGIKQFKRLVLPWNDNNNWSNFKKYLTQNKKTYPPFVLYNHTDEYEYEEGDVILGNPPFSILKEIVYEFNKNNIPFILFAPVCVAQDVYSNEELNYQTFYSPHSIMSDYYNEGQNNVSTKLISNFMDFKYHINKFSKCNHNMDTLFKKYETSYDCFKKHNVYGSMNHIDVYCYKYGKKHLDGRKLNIESNFKYVKMDVLNEEEFFNRGKFHPN